MEIKTPWWLEKILPVILRIKSVALIEIEANQEDVASRIVPDIEIRGIRFWFLLSACLIASIGLNTNSVAVIIGAMLVSPLMGPILGLGLGLAIRSRDVISLAARNLTWAVGGSLVLSTLYFAISPLDEVTPEILARTAPNLLDLFVATASAFAGVIAFTARGGVTIVPGVAIATAIMPPLCTAGFGIANGKPLVFLGAFYLFFVNALAITIVAFLLFKRMHFQETEEQVRQKKTLSVAITSAVLLVFIAPLGWTLYTFWEKSATQRQIRAFVREFDKEAEVVNWHYEAGNAPKVVIYSYKQVASGRVAELTARLQSIHPEAALVVRQAAESDETREVLSKFKSSPIYPMLSDGTLAEKLKIASQPQAAAIDQGIASLGRELNAWMDEGLTGSFFVKANSKSLSEILLLMEYTAPASKTLSERKRSQVEGKIRQWFTTRSTKPAELRIVWHKQDETGGTSTPKNFDEAR